MDKFQPAFAVPQGVQNEHVEALKVSAVADFAAADCTFRPEALPDARRALLEAFAARVCAGLEAGEPVAVRGDGFLQDRGPRAQDRWTVYLPQRWAARP